MSNEVIERNDGRLENFIPVSKTVTVSMTLAEYEAERKRCRDFGYTSGQRNVIYTLHAIHKKEYGVEILQRESFPEFDRLEIIAKILYGSQI